MINKNRASKTNIDNIPFGQKIATEIVQQFREHLGNTKGVKGKGLFAEDSFKVAVRLHNTKNGKNQLSWWMFREINKLAVKKNIILTEKTQECLKNHFFYDPIIEIKKTRIMEPMRDVEIEDKHCFVANGFICHNSQGAEYPLIIMPLIRAHGQLLLQRNLIYTAITRAKKKVIILGQASAIENAIRNDKIQKRNTMFSERIQQWNQGSGKSLRDILSKLSDYKSNQMFEKLLSLEDSSIKKAPEIII